MSEEEVKSIVLNVAFKNGYDSETATMLVKQIEHINVVDDECFVVSCLYFTQCYTFDGEEWEMVWNNG